MKPNSQLWSRIFEDQGGEVGRWDNTKGGYPTHEMYNSVIEGRDQTPSPVLWSDGGLVYSMFEEVVMCMDDLCGIDNTRLWASGRAG